MLAQVDNLTNLAEK